MADPSTHAKSSAKRFGGHANDYLKIHQWMDATKMAWCDPRHRCVRHSTVGIATCIEVFGQTFIRASDGITVPVRPVAEQHVQEDLGFIPTLEDWFGDLPTKEWMTRGPRTFVRKFQLAEEASGK